MAAVATVDRRGCDDHCRWGDLASPEPSTTPGQWLTAIIPDKGGSVNVPHLSVSATRRAETAINGTYMNTKDAA